VFGQGPKKVDEKSKINIPPGMKQVPASEMSTRRQRQRLKEDEEYTSVIVKRTDEHRRHPDDVLELAIQMGIEQLTRRTVSLVLSSITAGLILGFTAMAVGLAHKEVGLLGWPAIARLAPAIVYPLGFTMCILGGAQLFTEHTAMAVYPVLDRLASVGMLFRLWGLVLIGNLAGAFFSAILLAGAEPVIQVGPGYAAVGAHLVDRDLFPLLLSAVLAGWLMALGGWLLLSATSTTGRVLCIYIVTFLIGLGGLHHSIAGAAEIFADLLTSRAHQPGEALRFLAIAVVGNLLGGSVFVAALNYAHIRRSQVETPSSPSPYGPRDMPKKSIAGTEL
jgi:formate-nitrite transporter family protein